MKFMSRFSSGAGLLLSLGLVLADSASARLEPVDLKCEYAVNPLGIDAPAPRLFWKLAASARGDRQSAYEVVAAASEQALARNAKALWKSGKVVSDETIDIPYAGAPLSSSQRVFWRVRVWDQNDKASRWSTPASWTMGLLNESDWNARWISAPGLTTTNRDYQSMLMRREFTVKAGLQRALAHVCGLGQYELSLNGSKVGEDFLSPGWSKYDKTCLYDTRDITALLRKGPNALGLLLGNGMYNVEQDRYTKFTGTFGPLKAIVQVRLEYAGGATEIIGTDDQWRVAPGPITFSSVYGGEDEDARREPRGWNQPGFDDASWERPAIVQGPGGQLRGLSCAAPPLRAFETLRPTRTTPLQTNITVYDLGQNAPIMVRLRVKGPAGSMVRVIPAELLKPDGSVDRQSCGGGSAWWQYTLAGGGGETWFSKFFYHGCRYLQVQREPAPGGAELPALDDIEGVVVHSSSPTAGQFACSNELFNRTHALIRWAQRANIVSILTDCPHRERLGWLEQYHLNGPSLRYEFDLARLYTKGMNDMADSQQPDGLVPDIAPEYTVFGEGFRDSPEWGSAFVLVPWQQYLFDGDRELLRRYFEGMKRYAAYLGSKASHHIVSYGLGDWYDIGPRPPGYAQLTPSALTATAFYYEDTWVLSQAAAILGKTDEAKEFTRQAEEIRAAFNQEFFNPAKGNYATGSQCANAIPLVMNLVEPARRAAVLDAIVADVRQRGNANTAGDVGYRYVLRALADGGRSDVIFDMNNQSDKPGYGYQLKMGATSLTEAWNAGPSSSQNHFMLGQIMEWFYAGLAGIAPDPAAPGFKKILLRPQPVGDVTWVKCAYDSVRGSISSDWKREGVAFQWTVTIPASTTATVFVPASRPESVTESGLEAAKSPHVRFIRREDGRAVYEIDSGTYQFASEL